MKTLDELLQAAMEGDEEAQEEIKARFNAKEQEARVAARDLRLKTDSTLRERYPRALRAYERGRLKLSNDMTEDEVLEALKDKEDELAELGVPVQTQTEQPAAPPAAQDTSDEGGEDVGSSEGANVGAKALTGARGPSSPGGQPRDLVAEFFDAVKGSTIHDQERANKILVEINQLPDKGRAAEMIAQITHGLEAPPIIPTSI